MSAWRREAALVIERALDGVDRTDIRAVRRALRAAYPFGQRRFWPYKAWLLEIRSRLGHGLNRKPSGPQFDLFEARHG